MSIHQIDYIETIVIDDNSNKLEYSHFKRLREQKRYNNVTFLENDTNIKGAGACRNIGLSHARGKWILFADDDDYFAEKLNVSIEEYMNSDYDIVYFTPTSIQEDTNKLSIRHEPYEDLINSYLSNNKDSELFLRYKFYVPWSKLIRKELIDQHNIRFDEIIASNDVMFSTKIGYYAKKITVTKSIIYCVTRSKGSLTTTKSREIFQARFKAFVNQYNFLNKKIDKNEISKLDYQLKSLLWI